MLEEEYSADRPGLTMQQQQGRADTHLVSDDDDDDEGDENDDSNVKEKAKPTELTSGDPCVIVTTARGAMENDNDSGNN